MHSGVLNTNVATIHSKSKLYLVSRSCPSCCRFLSSLEFGLMSMWEVLNLFDSEAVVRVSGAAATVDYFG